MTRSANLWRRLPPWRITLGWTIIVIAIASMLACRLDRKSRGFLTPYDGVTVHEIHVLLDGRPLTSDAILDRYGIAVRGATALTPAGLQSIVRNRESRRPAAGDVFIRLHTRRNGGPETVWLWPEQ